MKFSLFLFVGVLISEILYSQNLTSESLKRAIKVLHKKEGVYLYEYKETLDSIDPYKDYIKKYKITKKSVIERLTQLVIDNQNYQPDFKARCLPVWEYGLEFRRENESKFFLLSFRCRTLMDVHARTYKDFTPQFVEFYKIIKYELDENALFLLDQK
ncbi:MAG: hypothetical protein NZ853_00735 [Leptospiraceae bacterium]|nr:hypothetical protein [Leptospiraceae bacterium]MDW7976246.1 hypothetical protein [Leptospiraceae bacterium]